MNALTVNVIGTPAPQGSKRAFVVNGCAVMTESSKKVKPWRQDVAAAVQAAMATHWTYDCPTDDCPCTGAEHLGWVVPAGPVRVDITYYLPRPRYHYRTGKHANELRPNAPTYVDKKPDKDKLDRATYDALTASGAIRDDAQIAAGDTVKVYADAATGARITIRPLDGSRPGLGTAGVTGAQPDEPATQAGRPATSTQEALL
jgi:Holliday junction resolvase RusA-like endonuclease